MMKPELRIGSDRNWMSNASHKSQQWDISIVLEQQNAEEDHAKHYARQKQANIQYYSVIEKVENDKVRLE